MTSQDASTGSWRRPPERRCSKPTTPRSAHESGRQAARAGSGVDTKILRVAVTRVQPTPRLSPVCRRSVGDPVGAQLLVYLSSTLGLFSVAFQPVLRPRTALREIGRWSARWLASPAVGRGRPGARLPTRRGRVSG